MCSQAHGLGDGAKQSLGHTGCQALSILFLYPHTALPVRRFLYPSLAGEKQAREVKSLAQGGPVGTEGAANVSCVLCCHSAISGGLASLLKWIQKNRVDPENQYSLNFYILYAVWTKCSQDKEK